ncbi:hypothetical protein RGU11_17625 [Rossellomorea marisflavi]|uniref:hypothetical protein n=1 Tax=Rossellomorea marisflavi TaxID=189381 RepID=UPI002853278D|nr:hypothetical protein [Rossellomorea marisflavi]MDR4938204.1 hypothetical protein [Rossellomorea marisflavi]
MNQTLNNASFIATLISIPLFFLATSSSMIVTFTESRLHIHPLSIVLVLTVLSFLAGFAGLFWVDNGGTYAKSMATISVISGSYAGYWMYLGDGDPSWLTMKGVQK